MDRAMSKLPFEYRLQNMKAGQYTFGGEITCDLLVAVAV